MSVTDDDSSIVHGLTDDDDDFDGAYSDEDMEELAEPLTKSGGVKAVPERVAGIGEEETLVARGRLEGTEDVAE
ncbi:hypothetical protein HK101_006823, partial [Irineochytrium annulatum]